MSDKRARLEPPDISEKGGVKGGQPQRSDERLFMQLLAFTGCEDTTALIDQLAAAGVRVGAVRGSQRSDAASRCSR